MKSPARKKRKAPSSPTPAASSSKSVATTSKKAKHTSDVDVSAGVDGLPGAPDAEPEADDADFLGGKHTSYEVETEYGVLDSDNEDSTTTTRERKAKSVVADATISEALRVQCATLRDIDQLPKPTGPDDVQRAINDYRNYNHLTAVPADFWNSLTDLALTLDFLYALHQDPFAIDVDYWLSRGALRTVVSTEEQVGTVYVRIKRYPDGPRARADFERFGTRFAAELPWVAQSLALAGASKADLLAVARNSLATKSRLSALDPDLGSDLCAFATPSFNVHTISQARAHGSALVVPYFGITFENTVTSRHADDAKALAQARFKNFLELCGSDMELYEVPLFDSILDGRAPNQERSDSALGLCESVLIASVWGAGLNTALGGVRAEVALPKQVHDAWTKALELLQPIQSPRPQPDSRTTRAHAELDAVVARLNKDEQEIFQRVRRGPNIHATARSQQDLNAASLEIVAGQSISLSLFKDISAEDFVQGIGVPHGPDEGRGMQLAREVRALFNALVPTSGPVPREVVRAAFGAYVDWWRILWHLFWWLCALYTSRLLLHVKPLIIVVCSNIVTRGVLRGDLAAVWQRLNPALAEADLQQFIDGTSPTNATELLEDLGRTLYPTQGLGYLKQQGLIHIRRVSRNATDLALIVVTPDPGHDKYDPALSRHTRVVYVLCVAIHEVLRRVVVAALEAGDTPDRRDSVSFLAWLQARKAETEKVATASGLVALLEAAKQPLTVLVPALAALRSPSKARAKSHQAPRANEWPVPESPDGRLELAEKVLEHEREMSSYGAPPNSLKLIPGDMVGEDDKYRGWVVKRQPHVDLSLSVSGYGGTTVEGVERARQIRQANAEKLKAMSSFFRDRRFKARDGAQYTPAEIEERNCIRRTIIKALKAFKTLDGMMKLRNKALDDVPRMGECLQCHALVLGSHSGSLHHCHAVKPPQSIRVNLTNFASLVRLLCPDDLLAHPAVQAFVTEEPVGLLTLPEKTALDEALDEILLAYEKTPLDEILRDAGIELPGVDRIPPLTATWLSDEMDWETKVFFAYQAALEDLTFGSPAFEPQHSLDINKVYKKGIDNLYKCLAGEKPKLRVYAGKCAYGYRGILAVLPGKRLDKCTWKHMCPNHNYEGVEDCPPVETERVESFLQLPRLAARHTWYLYAVEKRRNGPSPLLYGKA